MREELEKQLQAHAPKFLKDMYGDKMTTCMHWGIECGDGWYIPLMGLFTCIEALNEGICKDKGTISCDQVKEKFGGLRVYWHYTGEDIPGLIEQVDNLTDVFERVCDCTCELCGGLYIPKNRRRYGSLCPECEELRKKHGVWENKIPKEEQEQKDPEKGPQEAH